MWCSIEVSVKGNASGILNEDDLMPTGESVLEILQRKHPPGQDLAQSALFIPEESPSHVHPVIFDCIDADLIRYAAKHTNGAAGPTGIDSHGWR